MCKTVTIACSHKVLLFPPTITFNRIFQHKTNTAVEFQQVLVISDPVCGQRIY